MARADVMAGTGQGGFDGGKLHIFTDQIIERDQQGHIFIGGNSMAFWRRYLMEYDTLRIVTRVKEIEGSSLPNQLDHERIEVGAIPFYRGPRSYMRVRSQVRSIVRQELQSAGPILLRMPGNIASEASRVLARTGQPYGVEVIGDPTQVFVRGGVGGVAAPLYRMLFVRATRAACRKAASVAYVNRSVLPRIFPASPGAFTTHYSNVELPPHKIAAQPRSGELLGEVPHFLLVGTFDQNYKGFDLFVEAAAKLVGKGIAFTAAIAGEGRLRPQIEALAEQRGVGARISFLGRIDGERIFEEHERADLFLLPSRTEGLPRALIEAMARGVPSIATRVGGIPELLSDECLIAAGDSDALAAAIEGVLRDPAKRAAMSRDNILTAREYSSNVLDERRRDFYRSLRNATERVAIGRVNS